MTPNLPSTIAFLIWPIVALVLYRRQSVTRATLWTILGAQLFLPPNVYYKFEMIPYFDKGSIAVFSAFIGCLFVAGRRIRFVRQLGLAEFLIFLVIFSPVVTALLNSDPVQIGRTDLPGVGLYDGLSSALSQFVMVLPLLLGRELLRSPEDTLEILRTIVIAGLIYSLPMLFELRMSPVLSIWVYGITPGEMQQAFRDGGYRPIVFIGHGLGVAFYTMMSVVAAMALWRARIRVWRLPSSGVAIYLAILLYLCKTAASLIYGTLGAALIRFAKPRLQLQIAMVLTTIVLIYPLLRSADLVPTDAIVQNIAVISEERAGSLKTRFDQEQLLLAHAHDRIVFGWGRFGRSRLEGSVTDGAWVIILGQFGLVGFLALFGLISLPVFRAASALKFVKSNEESVLFAGLSLIVTFKIFDLVPNSGLEPWAMLLIGALLGRAEALRVTVGQSLRKKARPVAQNTLDALP